MSTGNGTSKFTGIYKMPNRNGTSALRYNGIRSNGESKPRVPDTPVVTTKSDVKPECTKSYGDIDIDDESTSTSTTTNASTNTNSSTNTRVRSEISPGKTDAKTPNQGSSKRSKGEDEKSKPKQRDVLDTKKGVTVWNIFYPSGPLSPSMMGPTKTWVVFDDGTGDRFSRTVWKGCIPYIDTLHSYDILYAKRVDEYTHRPYNAIVSVLKVNRTRMDAAILRQLIVQKAGKSESFADKVIVSLSNEAKSGNMGSLLREVGEAQWYCKNLELTMPYFAQWYAEELCPPFDLDLVSHLEQKHVRKLARLAANDPWKLCFQWMHDVPILEELSADEAETLADRMGAQFPDNIKYITEAYTRHPFGEARNRGDSYVTEKEALLSLGSTVFHTALKHGIIAVVDESDSESECDPEDAKPNRDVHNRTITDCDDVGDPESISNKKYKEIPYSEYVEPENIYGCAISQCGSLSETMVSMCTQIVDAMQHYISRWFEKQVGFPIVGVMPPDMPHCTAVKMAASESKERSFSCLVGLLDKVSSVRSSASIMAGTLATKLFDIFRRKKPHTDYEDFKNRMEDVAFNIGTDVYESVKRLQDTHKDMCCKPPAQESLSEQENEGPKNIADMKKQEKQRHVYTRGDLLTESRIVEKLIEISSREETELPVKPMKMRWPYNDKEAPRPNDEQSVAIETILQTRIGVIAGKPGTGKTTMTMRAVCSAFPRGTVIGIAFTGLAAKKQHETIGTGFTAHRVIESWKRSCAASQTPAIIPVVTATNTTTSPSTCTSGSSGDKQNSFRFADKKVVIVEECSMMPLRLLLSVLIALGESVTRVYLFGDPRQMSPPGGGASLLEAMIRRYRGTKVISELSRSMRITDRSGILVGNLDRICEFRIDDGFNWSDDPSSGHPFVFVKRGDTPKENVSIIRSVLDKCGVTGDSIDVQIMVHTNEAREQITMEWYNTGDFAKLVPFDQHKFMIGERIMFLKNNYGTSYKDSKYKSDEVMNGTVGVLFLIHDEPIGNEEATTVKQGEMPPQPIRYTGEQRTYRHCRRWISIQPQQIRICLDDYGAHNIVRAQPATVAKMQGQEVKWAIVLIDRFSCTFSTKELYTACSRGKERNIIIADRDMSVAIGSGRCPSKDFRSIVMSGKNRKPRTCLYKKLPQKETFIGSL